MLETWIVLLFNIHGQNLEYLTQSSQSYDTQVTAKLI